MPTSTSISPPNKRHKLKSVAYEETTAAKPPIPITVAPPPPASARLGVHPSLRPQTSPSPESSILSGKARSNLRDDVRRDSGLAPSNSTARESYTTLTTDVESTKSLKKTPSLPRLLADDESSVSSRHKNKKWMGNKGKQAIQEEEVLRAPDPPFRGITTEIPNSSLEDLSSLSQVEFSKRGSMLIGGKKANESNGNMNGHARLQGGRRQPSTSKLVPPSSTFSRVLSADDEMLSQKVRSMYDCRNDTRTIVEEGSPHPVKVASIEESREEGQTPERPLKPTGGALPNGRERSQERNFSRPITRDSREGPTPKRNNSELAGGIEDWDNIEGGEVDRYGFIVPRKPASRDTSSSLRPPSPTPPRIQRVSTLLQLASDAPRRSRSRVGRTPSLKGSTQSGNSPAIMGRRPSKRTLRPASSQGSYTSSIGGHHSRFRLATNRLPHNKDRRCMDEAGDMLTLPPGLADIAEFEGGRASNDLRSREWDREEKWRKMGKVVENGRLGGGMVFEFDTRSPKVIERTWKGIPDRWRASAWHAFLSASARKHRGMPSDAELIQTFNELLDQSSPDDVQIDIDVPRTINSHIMFRRRYRGGQRLLFRVLHCLSIYFPETGYVQGMAALAATLLCYFDEGMTFVMLVRMWQLRGLSKLYQPGFEGLMQGLEEFEKKWLGGGEVASKLTELGISSTAYGTRWYLTLFNYSIPFPAQLRVWDVFMLLGDADPSPRHTPSVNGDTNTNISFNGGLDVLHATSAALIDGTREILLDSDFENAMKCLTSWIPIRDEELLMRVAKAEWKLHRRKR